MADKKIKVYLNKMKTEYATIPVLSNNQKVNRKTTVFYAERSIGGGRESVFFIIRPKDAELLKSKGFSIQSIEVPKGYYPVAVGYSSGTKLEVRSY
ncbi:hypothetical protein EBZ38_11840 [bacterium]|nr:hypothetical protein [bacterium]NDD84945.1 hypothetical protein [bacterium]